MVKPNPNSLDYYFLEDDLQKLMTYDFKRKEELGKKVEQHNDAIRINVLEERERTVVKSPSKFLIVLYQLEKEYCVTPSYGLKLKTKAKRESISHFTIDFTPKKVAGMWYYDFQRPISVKNIHDVEKSINYMDLRNGLVIVNQIGLPAKREIARINDEYGEKFIQMEYFDSLKMKYFLDYN